MTNPSSNLSPEVQLPPENSENEAQLIVAAISSFAQPFAEAQKITAIETTKQTQIAADVTKSVFRGFFFLSVLIIILASVAMLTGKDQMAEKLIFALLGFLGGLGFAKWIQK